MARPRGITITPFGWDILAKTLTRLARRVSNLAPLYRGPINRFMTGMFQRQWATQGGWGGQRWAPPKESTLRAREFDGGGPLVDSGEMRESFINVHHPMAIVGVGPQTFVRGSRHPVADLHQKGFKVRQWGGRAFRSTVSVSARVIIPDPIPAHALAQWGGLTARYIGG